MLDRVDIIVPTWNNEQYLLPMLQSVLMHRKNYPLRIIVVNNGHPAIEASIPKTEEVKFIQAPDNLGWEGGLELGLKHSDAKYVCFMNDDAYIPFSSGDWLKDMMTIFAVKKVGAVGPISNCVMGAQNIWCPLNSTLYVAPFLIGFCILLRREALEKAGGICRDLPGGDDLDLSLRLIDAGYELAIDRKTFVFHHGFKTGERVRGGADQDGGWNSRKMQEDVNHALIRKHGFNKWFSMIHGQPQPARVVSGEDLEGNVIRSIVGNGTVLELGCGGTKTVPNSIGVDFYGNGELIPTIEQKSVADVKASVENLDEGFGKDHPLFDYIVGRHILEHLIDPIAAISHWKTYLKPSGRLVLAVPDERVCESIPLNPEHKHAFTPESMASLLSVLGFKYIVLHEPQNGASIVVEAVYEDSGKTECMNKVLEAVS